MQIFPFIKPQNDTQTTHKRSKTMKNERKRLILFWFSFYSLFGAWKIVGKYKDFNSRPAEKSEIRNVPCPLESGVGQIVSYRPQVWKEPPYSVGHCAAALQSTNQVMFYFRSVRSKVVLDKVCNAFFFQKQPQDLPFLITLLSAQLLKFCLTTCYFSSSPLPPVCVCVCVCVSACVRA